MATRTDRFLRAAVLAARRAKQWTVAAAQAADRLLIEARKRAESEVQRQRLQKALRQSGRVLKAAGQAALIAGLAAGIAAVRAERAGRSLPKHRARA
jgi:hypothetical protein